MEFLKKNYEKIVLGLVVLGLTAAVCILPVIIGNKRENLKSLRTTLTNPKIKELPALDIKPQEAGVQRLQTAFYLNLTLDHNLFNPVTWMKGADNRPVKVVAGLPTGPEALEVTGIKPLRLWLNFDSVSGSSYLVGFTNQAALQVRNRTGEKAVSLGNNNKSDLFSLTQVRGEGDKAELVLTLNDDGEQVTIASNRPYSRIQGYSADLRYTAGSGKIWRDQKVQSPLVFGDGTYNIVAITETNVTVESKQNAKKTTINFKAPIEKP
jgi:hypothetical protein